MSLIKVEQAKKDYLLGKITVPALKGVNLTVEKKEFLAIAGPSGSGKTTLLNLISGIEKPTSGRIFIDGLELSGLTLDQLADIRANKIGFIFQNFNLLPVLTALENVAYPLLLTRSGSFKAKRDAAARALAQVGLERFAHHKPMELSGGQRQRVAIARAIVMSPSVILADEPTANLDRKTGEEIISLMKKINEEENTSFVFSTHDEKIINMACRVVKLSDGTIVESGV